jgi:hypothetical protein
MSIADEILRLQQAKADLKTAIEAKGVTVPASTTLDGYAALVDQIQTGPILPYDAEVEYLQSTGNEYIDTGIVPSSDIRFTVDGQYLVSSGSNLIHGAMSSSGSTYYRFHIGINSNSFYGGIGTMNGTITTANANRHTFIITGSVQRAYVDSSYYTGNSSFPSVSIYLFARNTNGTAGNMHVFRMYSAEIYSYSYDKKLLDLIPVRKGTVGYLYDKVSGQLFGNANSTGAFTYGNDVT